MWLIVGLGNPGAEYAATRHNIGFMAVDRLAPAGVNFTKKFQGEIAQTTLGGESVLLLKPQTYMNLSGKSVQAAAAFYKVPPANIIVLHDELDLPLGKIRIKQGGGANGHNGLKDIDQMLGVDYWRIRLGIGHPGDKDRVHDHVLTRFTGDEQELLEKVLKAVTDNLAQFWQHSPEKLATKVAETINPQPPKLAKEKKVEENDGI